jgi:hypothetical protein
LIDQAHVTVTVPKHYIRTELNIKSLDSHTRKLAQETFITVDGKMLSCYSFKVLDNGCLSLEVTPDAFSLVQKESA